jgi:hypothetical protein
MIMAEFFSGRRVFCPCGGGSSSGAWVAVFLSIHESKRDDIQELFAMYIQLMSPWGIGAVQEYGDLEFRRVLDFGCDDVG